MVAKKHGMMSLRHGLREFSIRGQTAVKKEIKSFVDLEVLEIVCVPMT